MNEQYFSDNKENLVNEYILPYDNLIGGFIIPDEVSDEIIEFYKKSKNKGSGEIISGENITIDKNIKESEDVSFNIKEEIPELRNYFDLLGVCLDRYLQKYRYANEVNNFSLIENTVIQHYPPNGGYKVWHTENTGSILDRNRHLVFMTYLNDVEDGGTEFLYQNFISPAKKGLTLIWPSAWTHTHKSQVSKKQEKYIITGWYSFKGNNNE